jgi:hypothetical protein
MALPWLESLASREVREAVEKGDPASAVKSISVVAKSLSNAIASARIERRVH